MNEYHSIKKEAKVYHIDPNCIVGNNIETENWRKGTGGKDLCSRCKKPNKK